MDFPYLASCVSKYLAFTYAKCCVREILTETDSNVKRMQKMGEIILRHEEKPIFQMLTMFGKLVTHTNLFFKTGIFNI